MGKANINIKRGEQCKLRIMEREIIVSCTILAPKCTLYQLLWHLGVPCTIVPTCTLYHCTYVYLVPTIVAPRCTLYQLLWHLGVPCTNYCCTYVYLVPTIVAPRCTLYQLLWHLGVPCTNYCCTYVYLVPTIVAPTCTLYQRTTKIVWQLSVLEQIKETKSSRHNKIDINIKRHSMPLPTKSRGRLVGRKEGQKKGQVR